MDAPLIIHVDVDAFFASVEQVLDPSLGGRPVIVGGGVEGRGVVASASYAARRFGLKAGMPIFRARERCPDGVYLPPRFAEYNRFAARVFDVLSEVSPSVEQASLDECSVDLRGCERLYGAWADRPSARLPFVEAAGGVYRRREGRAVPADRGVLLPEPCRWTGAVGLWIKRAVKSRVGLNVSVGIGPNKLVARMASGFGKPDGAVLVEPGREAAFVGMFELKDVPGVGRVTCEKLRRWNVRSVQDARRLPMDLWEDAFGPERGAMLYHLVRGELPDHAAALRVGEPPRSIARETTFWTAASDYEFVESMLFYLTERLGRALRRERMQGRTVQVKLRYQDFSTALCSRSLRARTDEDERIFAVARSLLRARWRRTRRLRLVGVGLTDLGRACVRQEDLFDERADRSRRIDRCLDGLRAQFGFDVVRRGLSINLAAAAESDEQVKLPEPARP